VLFNSFEFIFLFLPITLFVFFIIGKQNKHQIAMSWLVISSLFFYGWWNPAYLGLIVFSMLFNYAFGLMLRNKEGTNVRKYLLWIGVITNLGFLGYFKYANFFIEQLNLATNSNFHLETIILPLAISFFTFQQIAFLIDSYSHETKEFNFLQYCLFVTFFPQLIAGPIVHHKEMMPQFANNKIYKFSYESLAIGVIIFSIGLFKKVILADGVAMYATPVFIEAEAEVALTFFTAWAGALAYTLQLYFDFSGYSDMAIGVALMFGIKLPINFNSPYKAHNIIEFWRRWHITLSRFLRDYLYITLGGSRKGNVRRYANLFITMLLGGIWHGAGWTFMIWGVLHGTYLMINHAWRKLRFDILKLSSNVGLFEAFMARALTLAAVIVGWVYFRAETVSGANHMLYSMFGGNGISLPKGIEGILGNTLANFDITFEGVFSGTQAKLDEGIRWIVLLVVIALFSPNSLEISGQLFKKKESLISKLVTPRVLGVVVGMVFSWSILHLSRVSEFLYFQF
jgi:D-alanyl-lipoteichoic acid acyltransferase DltB (MBOAT superfamily)